MLNMEAILIHIDVVVQVIPLHVPGDSTHLLMIMFMLHLVVMLVQETVIVQAVYVVSVLIQDMLISFKRHVVNNLVTGLLIKSVVLFQVMVLPSTVNKDYQHPMIG
jgi:hypothetical protein